MRRGGHRASWSVVLGLAAALLPLWAWACPVCGQGAEESRTAYLVMTFIMSLLPLTLIFGVIGAIVLRYRKSEKASHAVEHRAVPPSAASPKPSTAGH